MNKISDPNFPFVPDVEANIFQTLLRFLAGIEGFARVRYYIRSIAELKNVDLGLWCAWSGKMCLYYIVVAIFSVALQEMGAL